MYVGDITLHTGVANARQHIELAFDLILQGRITPEAVLGAPQPIEEAAAALTEPALKPVFVRPTLQQVALGGASQGGV